MTAARLLSVLQQRIAIPPWHSDAVGGGYIINANPVAQPDDALAASG